MTHAELVAVLRDRTRERDEARRIVEASWDGQVPVRVRPHWLEGEPVAAVSDRQQKAK